jgi:hypothetical protein
MKIAKDKKLHLAAGAIAGLVGGIFAAGADPGYTFAGGMFLASFVGIAKEVYDSTGGGTVDRMDVAYTAAGGLLPSLILAVAL